MVYFNPAWNLTRISRIAPLLALFFCGICSILLAVFVPSWTPNNAVSAEVKNAQTKRVTGEVEAMKSPDLEALVTFCTQHTTATRGFVVFRNGTCVLIKEPCESPAEMAHTALEACAKPAAKFLSEKPKDGGLVVTFQDGVFHRFPDEDVATLDEWSLKNLPLLLSEKEREIAAPGWVPPSAARLGLIARKRMIDDAASGTVVKILRPNTSLARSE